MKLALALFVTAAGLSSCGFETAQVSSHTAAPFAFAHPPTVWCTLGPRTTHSEVLSAMGRPDHAGTGDIVGNYPFRGMPITSDETWSEWQRHGLDLVATFQGQALEVVAVAWAEPNGRQPFAQTTSDCVAGGLMLSRTRGVSVER